MRLRFLLILTLLAGGCVLGDHGGTSTGNTMNPEFIRYSSSQALTDTPTEVAIVGLLGWNTTDGGELRIANEGSGGQVVLEVGRTFATALEAKLDDNLIFEYHGPSGDSETVQVQMSDDLTLLPKPSLQPCPVVVECVPGSIRMLEPISAEDMAAGVVRIKVASLLDDPPFAVYNINANSSIVIEDTTSATAISGVMADTICAFRLAEDGSSSTTYCEIATN